MGIRKPLSYRYPAANHCCDGNFPFRLLLIAIFSQIAKK
jgi:hypothetical protein